MGIQWAESPYLYRTVDSGTIYKYQGPGAKVLLPLLKLQEHFSQLFC